MNDVKDLLERAAADAGRSTVSSEHVYARAAYIRSCRRAVASGVLVVVLALVAFVRPAFDTWLDERHSSAAGQKRPARAFPIPINEIQRLEAIVELLPERLHPGGGFIQTDSLYDRRHQAPQDVIGPFDGRFRIPSGYLYIEVFDEDDLMRTTRAIHMHTLCEGRYQDNCSTTDLPGIGKLEIWEQKEPPISQWHGFRGGFSGVLKLENGSVLTISEAVSIKTRLKSLTRDEFRELMLRVEFLPEGM
ncbi:hypothetical protein ABZ348_03750 [Streptomyces sp. NPDC005963]|uniref:hypothetical protein n=1 Tax=Streptomyces sp. NPDC005963 TaxID=3156721 RepID=UPI0033FB5FC0